MRIVLFYIIACGFSWLLAGWLDTQGGLEAGTGLVAPTLFAYMFGPAIGSVIVTLLYDRAHFWTSLGFVPFKPFQTFSWVLIGWIIPLVLIALSTILTFALTGTGPADAASRLYEAASSATTERGIELPFTKEQFFLISMAVNVPLGILINTVLITLNEEMGWRGWLQPRLAGMGFWPMSIVIGALWGIWHAPIIWMGYNYPGMGLTGVGLMIVWTILLTPYFSLMRERGGNVWAAGAMHGSLNALAGVGLLFIESPQWPYNGLLGLGGFVLILAGWIGIAAYRKARPC